MGVKPEERERDVSGWAKGRKNGELCVAANTRCWAGTIGLCRIKPLRGSCDLLQSFG